MRAAVYERYGPPEVVSVREVPPPVPGKGEVRVRVHATAVTVADARIRAARFPRGFGPSARLAFGVTRPRRHVLGSCLSGVVESVGPDVAEFAIDDEVCGMAGSRMGTHAELAVVSADRLVRKPTGVSHDDAAGVLFGGTTAWQFLHVKSTVSQGDRVLVVGGSGAVGSNAVQLAAIAGAHVTAVTSASNADLVRRLGASEVVDYGSTDITALPDRYDLVVDTVGTLRRATGRRLLEPEGVLLLVAGDLVGLISAMTARNVRGGVAAEDTADMTALLDLVDDGSLRVLLDSTVPLNDIVAAHRTVDSGHKVGNIVVRPQERPTTPAAGHAQRERSS
ncbi:zinc-binding dehydrogenase [Nostocoides sp. F2B08]|uniref:NAD(P)-dependent alcohol dehydrogenase n=1 Tax=Nostocoides sp. F2B08 TaxID=2653936 RepID=UPI00126329FF|nr:NAD(P)-dependent alcohol dehydrogenase [Tetrasphaera sp. F2B08]KAB7744114.1 zinc-binding dehydrogenase [Tetrasphaera sp. F2B08]